MLTNEQKTILIPEAVERFMAEKGGMTQPELARISGVGVSYIHYILKRETVIPNQSGGTAIKPKYYERLAECVGLKLNDAPSWKHFHTQNFRAIIEQIEEVRAEKGRGTIDGDTGSGKSHSLKMYQKANPTNTFIVKCFADENAKEFAINIAETVGEKTHGTAGAIIKRVCKKLNSMDHAILIIDEAEHIKSRSGYINIVKSLADRLEGITSLMLCGMEINDILQKSSDRHKQNFRQTARRFSKRMRCSEDITEDIRCIAQEYDFSPACAEWLCKRMRNFGELEYMVTSVLKESRLINKPVSVALLNSFYIC